MYGFLFFFVCTTCVCVFSMRVLCFVHDGCIVLCLLCVCCMFVYMCVRCVYAVCVLLLYVFVYVLYVFDRFVDVCV